ncbi:MAG TPA: PIN domain nuclease [Candidatus Sulfotelmatobacter sp.]
MVIVDSTVWIDYLRGTENAETGWLDGQLQRQRLGLIDLILGEVLQGIRDDGDFARVRRELSGFQIFETGGNVLAIAAAQNYRDLRAHGYTVRSTIDCWIATFCLRAKHELLHRDHDFDCFEKALGLRVVHPAE